MCECVFESVFESEVLLCSLTDFELGQLSKCRDHKYVLSCLVASLYTCFVLLLASLYYY